ncbi:hypothetical protein ACLOJK_004604 [Asimina triloba]
MHADCVVFYTLVMHAAHSFIRGLLAAIFPGCQILVGSLPCVAAGVQRSGSDIADLVAHCFKPTVAAMWKEFQI